MHTAQLEKPEGQLADVQAALSFPTPVTPTARALLRYYSWTCNFMEFHTGFDLEQLWIEIENEK